MAASRRIPSQLSALFLMISITISPILAQDLMVNSSASEDLSSLQAPLADDFALLDTTNDLFVDIVQVKSPDFSQDQFNQIMAALDKLKDEKDKKSKKLPELTPAVLVSLGIRFPLFIVWCYQFGNFKETVLKSDKGMSDAISEGLKLGALSWLITEPFKDHTKPFYEYYRDKFDNTVNKVSYKLLGYLGYEQKTNTVA